MRQSFSGKAALVTGGAGGFGLSCAKLLARDGAAATLIGRTENSLSAAKDTLLAAVPDASVQIFIGDGVKPEDVGEAMDLAASGDSSLEIVISAVGAGMARPITESTADQFVDAVAYNVRPAFIVIREGVKRIPTGGAFVFISSTASEIPIDGMSQFCARRAALDHLCPDGDPRTRRTRASLQHGATKPDANVGDDRTFRKQEYTGPVQ